MICAYLRVAICSVHFLPIDGRRVHSVFHKPWKLRVDSSVNDVTLPRDVGEAEIYDGVWQGEVEGIRNIQVLTLAYQGYYDPVQSRLYLHCSRAIYRPLMNG